MHECPTLNGVGHPLKVRIGLLLLGTLLAPLPASSQEIPDENLLDLSLEELLNVQVSVASLEEELIIETPAVVSYLDPQVLRRMGLTKLEDWISFSPGFVFQAGSAGQPTQMVRGIQDPFNQKVLFLLDGVPYWQPSHSDVPLRGIPLEAIDHVELIRGPGSVIHGSNASGGVINVVTKRGVTANTVTFEAGDHGFLRGSAYGAWSLGTGTVSVALEHEQEDPYEAIARTANTAMLIETGSVDLRKRGSSVWLRGEWGGLSATLHRFESKTLGLAGETRFDNRTDLVYAGSLASLNYARRFDSGLVSVFADVNNAHPRFEVMNVSGPIDGGFRFANMGEGNNRARLGLRGQRRLLEGVSLLGGYEYERRTSEVYELYDGASGATLAQVAPATDIWEQSLYGQADFKAGSVRVLFGARYIRNELAGSKVTPRAAVIYSMDDRQSVKWMYAQGFNAPNVVQQFLKIPRVIVGDPSNRPETVSTLEMAYSYQEGNRLFVANAFHYWTSDFIQRVATGNGLEAMFQNAEAFGRSGLELDFQQRTVRFDVMANLAYNLAANQIDPQDLSRRIVPAWTANLGATTRVGERHQFGGSWRFVSERAAADAFHRVDLSYEVTTGNVSFGATLENALGQAIRSPELGGLLLDRFFPAFSDDPRLRFTMRWILP